ncbi:MAG: hypothetical protein GY701_34505, partial [Sulfitobacter sp.]|nr:hypothetical protein [Sulfitobacter sp.]
DYNASTQQAGTEGDIVSLSFFSRLSADALQVEGEYAGSRFDADISDDRGKEADYAIRAKAFGRLEKADWEISYRYFGPDFASIANPTGTKDREEIRLGGGVRWGQSRLHASLLHNQDNVGQDPLLPVIHNTSGTLNYSVTAPDWPVLFASASRTHQESFDEPVGFPGLENAVTTLSLGSSLAAQRWNLTPVYSFTQFDDRAAVSDNDSDTHVLTVAGGIRPTDASAVNPSVTYSRIKVKSTDVATRTWQAALSGVVGWWGNQMNLNATVSWLDNQTSDGAIDTNTWSGALQFNWSVEKYLFGRGRQTLSLRGQYNLTDNHILDSDREDYIIYVVLSVGVPWKAP